MRRVHRQAKRNVAGLLYPADNLSAPIEAAANVELKNFRMIDAGGDFFQRRLRDRAEKIQGPKLRSSFGYRSSALRRDGLQRADRRHHDRNTQLLSKKSR